MSDTLTIRNLTADSLKLVHIEHLDRPGPCEQHDQGPSVECKPWRPAVNVTKRMRHAKLDRKKDSEIEKNAFEGVKPSKTELVHTLLEAFEATQTKIPTTPSHNLRLLFEGHKGEAWHVEISASGRDATGLLVTGDDTQLPYIAIYNPQFSNLALFDGYNPSKWMQPFPDITPLSALSIPGTHNSPACYPALPSVRCQVVPITTQLEQGIRFLDVRVQLDDTGKGARSNAMQLMHSVFPISFRSPELFVDLIREVYHFLRQNPGETVIMSLKREGRGSGTDALFAERLEAHYTDSPFWHTEPGIPNLGEVRGKIVILRRFKLGEAFGKKGFGIDATDWADNHANYQHGDIHIQDYYKVTSNRNIWKKIKFVTEHLERAAAVVHSTDPIPHNGAATDKHPLFINYLSANNFWTPGCWPEKIAAKLDPAVLSFLCEGQGSICGALDASNEDAQGDGGLGIVVCDWVGANGDWDLVRAIIGTNSRLLAKLEQGRRRSGNL